MSKLFIDEDGDSAAWSKHDGGPMPTAATTIVVVRYRCGDVSVVEAGKWRWQSWPEEIGASDWDIIAWRLPTERDIRNGM